VREILQEEEDLSEIVQLVGKVGLSLSALTAPCVVNESEA